MIGEGANRGTSAPPPRWDPARRRLVASSKPRPPAHREPRPLPQQAAAPAQRNWAERQERKQQIPAATRAIDIVPERPTIDLFKRKSPVAVEVTPEGKPLTPASDGPWIIDPSLRPPSIFER